MGAFLAFVTLKYIWARKVEVNQYINSAPEYTGLFDLTSKLLAKYDLGAAEATLAEANKLTQDTHSKYRYNLLLGHLHRLKKDNNEAARYYFKAKEIEPDNENAQCMEILGLILTNQNAKAAELIPTVRQRFPESGLALSLWLQSSPENARLVDLEKEIPPHLLDHEEVLTGRAIVALRERDGRKGVELCRLALKKDPDSLLAKKLLINHSLIPYISNSPRVLNGAAKEEMLETIKLINEYRTSVGKYLTTEEAVDLQLNLVLAGMLVGDETLIEHAVNAAYRLAPADPNTCIQVAHSMITAGKRDKAISILMPFVAKGYSRHILTVAQFKASARTVEEFQQAEELLRDGPKDSEDKAFDPEGMISAWYETLTKVRIYLKRFEEVDAFLESDKAKQLLGEVERLLLTSIAAIEKGDLEQGAKAAIAAAGLCNSETEHNDYFQIARLLKVTGRNSEAVELLKKIVNPNSQIEDVILLMTTAWEAEDYQFAADFGMEVIKTGVEDEILIDLTIAALNEISPTRALELIANLLVNRSEGLLTRLLRFRRSFIGFHLGQHELIEKDATRLPSLQEIQPQFARAMIYVLRFSSTPIHSIDVAYQLFRIYPNILTVNVAVIHSVLPMPGLPYPPPAPNVEIVGLDSAVQIEDAANKETQWYVIEDKFAKPTLNEIAFDSDFATKLIGKKVGDVLLIPSHAGITKKYEIKSVVHKYIYRFQRCSDELSTKFPDQKEFFRFSIPKDGTILEQFAELLAMLSNGKHKDDTTVAVYMSQPLISIHLLESKSGKSLPAVIANIASSESGFIRCCQGSLGEQEEAHQILRDHIGLVLDASAVATLFLLHDFYKVDLSSFISHLPSSLYVPELVIRKYEDLQRDLSRGNSRIRLTNIHCNHPLKISEGEESLSSAKSLESLIAILKSKCEIVIGGTCQADLKQDKRIWTGMFGLSSVDAAKIAKQKNAAVWTDDYSMGELLKFEDIKRVWTQIIIKNNPANTLSQEAISAITFAFLALKYEFTTITYDDVISAGNVAKWDTTKYPLDVFFKYLSTANIHDEWIILNTSKLLKHVWEQPTLTLQSFEFTRKVISSIGKRDNGRIVILALKRVVPIYFNLNVIAAQRINLIIDDWIRDQILGNEIIVL